MDGLKQYLQQAGNTEIQEQFYNGWTHNHYVTSVFCFCPCGTIPIAFFNVPGSVHDSQVAELGKIYLLIGSVCGQNFVQGLCLNWVPVVSRAVSHTTKFVC
jgi:hypothetical protein